MNDNLTRVERLYLSTRDALIGFLVNRNHRENAEDFVHDAFARMAKNGLRGVEPQTERGYAFTAVRNRMINEVKRRPTHEVIEEKQLAHHVPSPEDELIWREEKARFDAAFRAAFDTLSHDTQNVLILRSRELAFNDVVALLDCSSSEAARSLASRGMVKLKEEMRTRGFDLESQDWLDALDSWIDAEIARLRGPVREEEVLAFRRGELARAAAARVRALMIYEPSLTPLLRNVPHSYWKNIAAALLLVLCIGMAAVLFREDDATLAARYEFVAGRTRGAEREVRIAAGAERYVLVVHVDEPVRDARYRVEILRDGMQRVFDATDVLHDDAFTIDLAGRTLRPGEYRIDVYANGRVAQTNPFVVHEAAD